MFAIGAVIAFAIALIMHLIGHGLASAVETAALIGLVCLAAHFAISGPITIRRQG